MCVHCNSHVLNLVIVKACSFPLVPNMAGTITECANFFNYSPKRLRCLKKVISLDQPESQGTKISDPCHTRWVEHHEAHETFVQLLPSVVKTFEVILDEQQHQQYSSDTSWNCDRNPPKSRRLLPYLVFFPVPHVLDGHDENSGIHKAD